MAKKATKTVEVQELPKDYVPSLKKVYKEEIVGKLMQQNTQLINIDVMKAAFQEYAGKSIAKTKKPSIRRLLFKSQEKARRLDREKVRQKDRAKER